MGRKKKKKKVSLRETEYHLPHIRFKEGKRREGGKRGPITRRIKK